MIIEIRKLDLAEGEEVLEFGDKVMRALSQSKAKLKKSLRLIGIYNDHIVTRDAESGRLFKMAIAREGGAVTLGAPEEVQQSFTTLTELREQKKLKDAAEKAKAKKVMVETGETDGHKHTADVDAEGNGMTDTVNGHKHEIRGWQLLEAGGHRHSLQKPQMEEEEAAKKPPKKMTKSEDDAPRYIKIEKASLWKGVV